MRIVFVGTVDFSAYCLERVLEEGGEVVAVLTLSPEEAGFHSDYADLEPIAAAHRIPCHRVRDVNAPQTVELVRSLAPDVLLVLGWSQLLGAKLIEIPPLGAIGSHPALLPRNRGRHPVVWTLVEGLDESGLTFFYLDTGADSGDILWQRAFPISVEDDAATVYARLKDLAGRAIAEFLPQLEAGSAPRVPQDSSAATVWRKRNDADRWIEWNAPSMTVYNLIRGLARPYVGALTRLGDESLVVWRARLADAPLDAEKAVATPGTVLSTDNGSIAVRTGDGYLWLLELGPGPAPLQGAKLGGQA